MLFGQQGYGQEEPESAGWQEGEACQRANGRRAVGRGGEAAALQAGNRGDGTNGGQAGPLLRRQLSQPVQAKHRQAALPQAAAAAAGHGACELSVSELMGELPARTQRLEVLSPPVFEVVKVDDGTADIVVSQRLRATLAPSPAALVPGSSAAPLRAPYIVQEPAVSETHAATQPLLPGSAAPGTPPDSGGSGAELKQEARLSSDVEEVICPCFARPDPATVLAGPPGLPEEVTLDQIDRARFGGVSAGGGQAAMLQVLAAAPFAQQGAVAAAGQPPAGEARQGSPKAVTDGLGEACSAALACPAACPPPRALAPPRLSPFEIQPHQIKIGRRIAVGGFSEVFLGRYQGTLVAVKRILNKDASSVHKFMREIQTLARLRHPNLILFIGFCMLPDPCIVSEFMPRGSLFDCMTSALHSNPALQRVVAISVARGMAYLHSRQPPILHMDLKSPNILADERWRIKVADFGLSLVQLRSFAHSTGGGGTPEWMAPEVLRSEKYDGKADVYSFGVVLWEMLTGERPWEGMNSMQVVGAVGFQKRRLPPPQEGDPVLVRLCERCTSPDPADRPSFLHIINQLEAAWRLRSSAAALTHPAGSGARLPAPRQPLLTDCQDQPATAAPPEARLKRSMSPASGAAVLDGASSGLPRTGSGGSVAAAAAAANASDTEPHHKRQHQASCVCHIVELHTSESGSAPATSSGDPAPPPFASPPSSSSRPDSSPAQAPVVAHASPFAAAQLDSGPLPTAAVAATGAVTAASPFAAAQSSTLPPVSPFASAAAQLPTTEAAPTSSAATAHTSTVAASPFATVQHLQQR